MFRVCFIKTTNLDGESNLKIRRPVDLGSGDVQLNDAAVMGLRGMLQCEPPNANLHQFQGRFEAHREGTGAQGTSFARLNGLSLIGERWPGVGVGRIEIIGNLARA